MDLNALLSPESLRGTSLYVKHPWNGIFSVITRPGVLTRINNASAVIRPAFTEVTLRSFCLNL